jgi:ankyrin repeat protein
MAGRDPDGGDGGAPPPQRARPDDPPAVFVCGLEVGLLDVGRVVALNGFAEACKRLAFVASSFYLERDLLMATKRVRYGGKQRTRLMGLARKGDVERVSFLLKVGAEVGAADAEGWTALHWASEEGHEPIVRLLLDGGADARAATTDADGETPLHLASQRGHESMVRLLLDKGANVGARTTVRVTALHLASEYGREPVVRLLLERDADVGALDVWGWTPLHIASTCGREPVVRLLIARGADVGAATTNDKDKVLGRHCTLPARRATRPSSSCCSTRGPTWGQRTGGA